MLGRLRVIPFAMSLLAWLSACAAAPRFPVVGQVAGQPIITTVDSPVAQYYLGHYLRGGRSDRELVQTIESVLREQDPDPYDREALEQLSQRLSTDFVTIHFVARLYERAANRRAQDAFHAYLAQLIASRSAGRRASPHGYQTYALAFVPGYAYKKDRTTGADFARQRAILRENGFRTVLIETDELGSVERNAGLLT